MNPSSAAWLYCVHLIANEINLIAHENLLVYVFKLLNKALDLKWQNDSSDVVQLIWPFNI